MSKIASGTFLALAFCSGFTFGQNESLELKLQEIEEFKLQIEDLERQYGRYDLRLTESLSMLAQNLISLDQFGDAHVILDRVVQIYRISEGLFTQSQLPILLMKAENYSMRGEWDDANRITDHLLWLYATKYTGLDDGLIRQLLSLRDYHINALVEDDLENQADHFGKAEEITRVVIGIAERLWAANDVRILDLHYSLVQQYYLQTAALEQGGTTANELRSLPGSSQMRSKQAAKTLLYLEGQNSLGNMRELLVTTDPRDLEAIAMIELYIADWELMYNGSNISTLYSRAYASMLEAGIDDSLVQTYFELPSLLPKPGFYRTLEHSLADDRFEGRLATPSDPTSTTGDSFQFVEWSSNYPNIPYSYIGSSEVSENFGERNRVTMAFELAALAEGSKWVNDRYVTSVSMPQQIELLTPFNPSAVDMELVSGRVHQIFFRPKLVEGVAQPFKGVLDFQYFAE